MGFRKEKIYIYIYRERERERVMLTSALRALINNPVKENFYDKRKKLIF